MSPSDDASTKCSGLLLRSSLAILAARTRHRFSSVSTAAFSITSRLRLSNLSDIVHPQAFGADLRIAIIFGLGQIAGRHFLDGISGPCKLTPEIPRPAPQPVAAEASRPIVSTPKETGLQAHALVDYLGDLLPPSPPVEKATAPIRPQLSVPLAAPSAGAGP
jgi:hypothetical protein